MKRAHYYDPNDPERQKHRKQGRSFFGFLMIIIGIGLILKITNIIPYFDFDTLWPFCLIGLGLLIGVTNRFRNHAWWILILIGTAHSIPPFTIMGASSEELVWPAALVVAGIFIISRPGKKKDCRNGMEVITNNENNLNIDVTFGGRKEIVTSKDFRGGNINTTFGGIEVNMVQADSTLQPMILNLTVSFGGVELIIPSHWELQNEIHTTMASVEDHRSIRTSTVTTEEKKILVLRGSCSFGSVEIKSY